MAYPTGKNITNRKKILSKERVEMVKILVNPVYEGKTVIVKIQIEKMYIPFETVNLKKHSLVSMKCVVYLLL